MFGTHNAGTRVRGVIATLKLPCPRGPGANPVRRDLRDSIARVARLPLTPHPS